MALVIFWNQGTRNGQGESVMDDGSSYNGMYKDGLRNGIGTSKLSNGDIYEGNLKLILYVPLITQQLPAGPA
jgi:hypothetical protein